MTNMQALEDTRSRSLGAQIQITKRKLQLALRFLENESIPDRAELAAYELRDAPLVEKAANQYYSTEAFGDEYPLKALLWSLSKGPAHPNDLLGGSKSVIAGIQGFIDEATSDWKILRAPDEEFAAYLHDFLPQLGLCVYDPDLIIYGYRGGSDVYLVVSRYPLERKDLLEAMGITEEDVDREKEARNL